MLFPCARDEDESFVFWILFSDKIARLIGSFGIVKCKICGKFAFFYANRKLLNDPKAVYTGLDKFIEKHDPISACVEPSVHF